MILHRAGGVLAGLALAAVVGGCSGATTPGIPQAGAATVTAAPDPATAAAQTEIGAVQQKYEKALLDRDFTTACAILTEDAAASVSSSVARNGGPSGLSCVQAFQAVYQVPQSAAQLDAVSRGVEIESIEVAGATATVTFGVNTPGNSVTGVKRLMTRVGGTWRVEGTS